MGRGGSSGRPCSSSSEDPSHCSPPLTASFSTALLLVDTPPPQVALHSPQLLHSSQTHGQGWEFRAALAAATSDSSWSRCSPSMSIWSYCSSKNWLRAFARPVMFL